MHDTMLLNRISEAITETCEVNNIIKINTLTIVVSDKSHINEQNLLEHLKLNISNLIGECTQIDICKENIEDQTAIIHSIQGEQNS